MSEPSKKYCPKCRDRISHAATRCSNCGHNIVSAKRVLICVLLVVAAVATALIALRFMNIRFF